MRNFSSNSIIAVVGLGYVGLPVAVAFSKKFNVFGYDKNPKRIYDLNKNIDKTDEFKFSELKKSNINFTNNFKDLKKANIFIVAVPTPIYANKSPNLSSLLSASKIIGKVLKKGDLVIFESTVYPGVTEDICVPILAKESKLKFNQDFFCGYSPERINPGDASKKFENIPKIVSGSTKKISNYIKNLYSNVVKAKIFQAESIKIAEAAKVIENTQRDLNIAFINELTKIFDKMSISTYKVLEAASTKWNFLQFYPGLVGGHCIGVDPYYLTHKSLQLKYKPKIILAGRKVNDEMYIFLAKKILTFKRRIKKKKFSLLILGSTFKENCNDTRNSQIPKLVNLLKKKNIRIVNIDPFINSYTHNKLKKLKNSKFDCILYAVAHKKFANDFSLSVLKKMLQQNGIILDFKNVFFKKKSKKIYSF